MTETMQAPSNLEDGYLLYLAALRETGLATIFDARVILDAKSDRNCREDVGPRRPAAAVLIAATKPAVCGLSLCLKASYPRRRMDRAATGDPWPRGGTLWWHLKSKPMLSRHRGGSARLVDPDWQGYPAAVGGRWACAPALRPLA